MRKRLFEDVTVHAVRSMNARWLSVAKPRGFATLNHRAFSHHCILPVLAATDPRQSVVAGRKALDQWWWIKYPWYDSTSDGVQRIDVSKPWFWDWDWLDIDWRALLPSLPSSLLEWVAWILIVALLVGLIYMLLRAYFAGRRGEGTSAGRSAGPSEAERRERIESLPFPVKVTHLDLLAEARRHYQQANYGEAIKYLFSYQLVQLDKHQLVRLARGKTNRQYLREVGRHGSIRDLLERTMVTFEDFFFGNQVIQQDRFEWCWTRLEQFESLVAEHANGIKPRMKHG